MPDALNLWEKPQAEEVFMFVGWRQWADAGSVSSGLPQYLIQQTGAHKIGELKPDGFYLFQIPGTHDLLRPLVEFKQGFPIEFEVPKNEFYYAGDDKRGVLVFIGDVPHMHAERYVASILQAASELKVKRIIGLGGVYGEVPYNRERAISSVFSLQALKEEIEELSVSLSAYKGGASIGSYMCRRAGDQGMAYISFYAFVPLYDFSANETGTQSIRIENDYMAWLGVMQRINHLLKVDFNLSDLEMKSRRLVKVVDERVDEIDAADPELGVRAYIDQLAEDFVETHFEPLDEFWEEKLRDLFNDESDVD